MQNSYITWGARNELLKKPYRTYICLKDLISDIASKIAETKSKLVEIKCSFYIKVYGIPHMTNEVGRHKFPIVWFIKMKKKIVYINVT